jgi:hypothetical protein
MPLALTFRLRKEHPFAHAASESITASLDAIQMING